MKKYLIAAVILILVLMTFFFLGSNQPDTNLTPQKETTAGAQMNDDTQEERGYTKDEAEALLGIMLPDDAAISIILDNANAAGVLGTTQLSIDEAQEHFQREMATNYNIARSWGLSPLDSDLIHSATYRGSGENWAVILRDENGARTFDLQRQY